MRIVLLGDIHVSQLRVWPWHLLGKRVLGQANLWLRRRFRFKLDYLPGVIGRAAQLKPDLVLCSGDLTTTALPDEFEGAMRALSPLLEMTPMFLVPGNHDRYTFTAARAKRFEQFFGPHTAAVWPHVRRLGPRLVLIGLDPTRPNFITDRGRLGPAQLDRLAVEIKSLSPEDRLIVLCHYTIGVPPGHKPEQSRHAMIDASKLIEVLRGPRPVLYVHGHEHEPWCTRSAAADNIVTLNAGAPAMISRDWPCGQGFWEIETDPGSAAADWRFTHHAQDAGRRWQTKTVAAGQGFKLPAGVE